MLDKPGFEYVAIVLGTTYLIPQLFVGFKTKQLGDVSTLSMIFLIFASMLWSYYLYSILNEPYLAYASAFVTFNAVIILCMKYTYYVIHLKERIQQVESNV